MEGEGPLSLVVALFSVVFPCLKLALMHVAAYGGRDARHRVPSWLRALSNWSMLDVVLVALLVFAAKTSGLAAALTQAGLWFFAASAAMTVAASALLRREHG